MTIRDIMQTGVSFEEFVNQDTDAYKEKTLKILDTIKFTEEQLKRIRAINKKLYILICAEMWCPDCMINVPVVEKMRQLNKNISLSIVGKERTLDFFQKYALDEKVRIPTFVFLNEEFNEMGSIVEHPRIIREILASGNQPNRIVAMRKYRKGEYAQEILNDILEIILRDR